MSNQPSNQMSILLRERGRDDIADSYEDKTQRGDLDLLAADEIDRLADDYQNICRILNDEAEPEIRRLRAALERAYQEADDHLEDLQLAGYHHKIWYPNAVRLVEHLKESLGLETPKRPPGDLSGVPGAD